MLRMGTVVSRAVWAPGKMLGLFGLLPEQLETRTSEQIIASTLASWEVSGNGN